MRTSAAAAARVVVVVQAFLAATAAFTVPSSSTTAGRRTTQSLFPLYQSSTAAVPSARSVPEGLLKTVSQPGNGVPVKLGDIATVKYTCYLPGDDKSKPPFAKSDRQQVVVGDGAMIAGWDAALRTMTVGERAVVRVTDPSLAYGNQGVPPLIPSDAELEFDIEVLDSQPSTANIDFDSLATAGSTPRTASEIAAAYEARQAERAKLGPEKEGLEGFIEKAKNFYFFGLFEGETGQQAPWFLRPSITFPLAFLVVGAAFYVSFATGAISERGASVKDELDEIILSSNADRYDVGLHSRLLSTTTTSSLDHSLFRQFVSGSAESAGSEQHMRS